MSAVRSCFLVLALACAPLLLSAQTGTRLGLQFVASGDTVVAVPDGGTVTLEVQAGYDGLGQGVDTFALRLYFDPARFSYASAVKLCSDNAAPLNVTSGASSVDVSTASCKSPYYGESLFRITFQLAPGVTDGAWFSFRPLSIVANGGTDRTLDATSDVAQVCHGTGVWGDLDGDGRVNSRDALATLSYAVGLAVPGSFDVSGRGDVDADGQVTSRDALAMLSAAIDLPTYGFRVGQGVVDYCAPQLLLPRRLYFSRTGANPGAPGVSGLSIRASLDSTVTIVGDSAETYLYNQWRPRVSPGGSSVLFVCNNPYYYYPGICKANADGSSPVHLTAPFNNDVSPDWSPDGSQIVFLHNGAVWLMDANGGGAAQAPGAPAFGVSSVSWQPQAGSRTIAYINTTGYGEIHATNVDAAADVLVRPFSCCAVTSPRWIDWNPAGDSLAFDTYVNGYSAIATVPATAGAALDVRIAWARSYAQHPAWTDQGILFDAPFTTYRLFLLRPDGAIVQVRPDNVDDYLPGMSRQ
ncbi:MAG: dockerin type I domain-containing protein [Gemmatimonadales bacterium]